MYKKLVLGIDQSYTRTGISIAGDSKLLKVSSIAFKGCKNKVEKRQELTRLVEKILRSNHTKAGEIVVICERIRTFSTKGSSFRSNSAKDKESKSQGEVGSFLNINYIKATGALIACIVDTAYKYNINVYSVDTRSWKAQIIGTSKASKGNKKLPAISFVRNLGFNLCIGTKKSGEAIYDDDAADSACIALYGFLPASKQRLKREE